MCCPAGLKEDEVFHSLEILKVDAKGWGGGGGGYKAGEFKALEFCALALCRWQNLVHSGSSVTVKSHYS